jgi:hypothetical protein
MLNFGFSMKSYCLDLERTWTMSRDLTIDLMAAELTKKPTVVFVVVAVNS